MWFKEYLSGCVVVSRHVIMFFFFFFQGKCAPVWQFSVFIYVYARNIVVLSVTVSVSALKQVCKV